MWHHLMVTWEQESGRTKMYFDGRPQSAFWVWLLMTAAPLHTAKSGCNPCFWRSYGCHDYAVICRWQRQAWWRCVTHMTPRLSTWPPAPPGRPQARKPNR